MRLQTPELLWATSRFLHQHGCPLGARMVKGLNWMMHKCLLPGEAMVGHGLILEHYALGVVIHPQVTIGNNCRVYHHVTLAAESAIGSRHRIVLGDNVILGAHSIVVARHDSSLFIGEGSILGAGSVLLASVPPHQVWAGNPAQKIKDLP
jgi:serine acetyltransferase